MTKLIPPGPEAITAVRAVATRRLSAAEVEAYLATPVSPEERAEIHSLIEWFTRRYPAPADRLAYARRAYARWRRAAPG